MRAALLILLLATSVDIPAQTCTNHPPATRFDMPTCDDLAAGNRLEAALKEGDVSVLGEVRRRYEKAFTYRERHRLGRLLLDHVDDDTTIWNDLSGEAVWCVRHAPDSEALEPLAKRQHADDPSRVWWASYNALATIAHDPRSRHLLRMALGSDEAALHPIAVAGLASQKDVSALPAIAATLDRLGSDGSATAAGLVHYASDEADALAMKFLNEEQRERYRAVRER